MALYYITRDGKTVEHYEYLTTELLDEAAENWRMFAIPPEENANISRDEQGYFQYTSPIDGRVRSFRDDSC